MKFSEVMYFRCFFGPPSLTFSIAMSIYCQMMVNIQYQLFFNNFLKVIFICSPDGISDWLWIGWNRLCWNGSYLLSWTENFRSGKLHICIIKKSNFLIETLLLQLNEIERPSAGCILQLQMVSIAGCWSDGCIASDKSNAEWSWLDNRTIWAVELWNLESCKIYL